MAPLVRRGAWVKPSQPPTQCQDWGTRGRLSHLDLLEKDKASTDALLEVRRQPCPPRWGHSH